MIQPEDILPYSTHAKRWRVLYACSISVTFASVAFAMLYLTEPKQVAPSLLGVLADHRLWASLQAILAIILTVGLFHGGPWLRLAHGIGMGMQTFYALMWLASGVVTNVGFFVGVGVAVIALNHWALAAVRWPVRESRKRRGE